MQVTERHGALVSVDTLAAHRDDPDWVVLDCRFSLADPDAGRRAWEQAHIPGALYADLDRDLSSPVVMASGRHPLPDIADMTARFAAWGIDERTQVVAYDDSGGAIAARAWWLLQWLGHGDAAVLDGGIQAWQAAGLPLTDRVTARPPRVFDGKPDLFLRVEAGDLQAALDRGDIVLLDARDAGRFMGEADPIDSPAGHIPGAHNHPWAANLDRDGRFLPAGVLRDCYEAAACGHPPSEIVCMCGSGVTACHNIVAMHAAGLPGARLYVGSWSEWIRDPTRPVATGPDTGC